MSSTKKKPSVFADIIFNIAIPTLILSKFSDRLGENGPLIALLMALSFPIGYAVYEYSQQKKYNMISVIGIINVLFTGGLALLKIEGSWFAVKEAAFPLLIGVIVLISAFSSKPLIKILIYNDTLMNLELIESQLVNLGKARDELNRILKNATILLSLSFLLSAALNYYLAKQIFTELPLDITETERANLLNQQISSMTWKSYIVISIPSLIAMGFVLWYFFNRLSKLTHMPFTSLMKEQN